MFEALDDILAFDVDCPCQGITLEAHQGVHFRRHGTYRQLPREPRGPQSELERIHLVTTAEWLREQLIAVSVMANVTRGLGERKGRSASHAMRDRHVEIRTPEATGTSGKDVVHL